MVSGSRIFAMLLVAVPVLAAVLLACAWRIQRSVLFPRPGAPAFDASRAAPGVEKLAFDDPAIAEAWLLPPSSARSSFPVVLFAHGNAELIDHWVLDFEVPRTWGLGVVLVEYPGYGRSPGEPSEASIVESLTRVYDVVSARADVISTSIVGYGRSLGGAAICQLAARRPLAALILESTFTSVRDMARGLGMPGWLVRDPFESLPVVASFPGPVLLMHGTRDRIVPFDHARRFEAANAGARLHAFDCGHNDCRRPWAEIRDFLAESEVIEVAADERSSQ